MRPRRSSYSGCCAIFLPSLAEAASSSPARAFAIGVSRRLERDVKAARHRLEDVPVLFLLIDADAGADLDDAVDLATLGFGDTGEIDG